MHDRVLYRLTWLALALSLGHHLDHLIRHNAVGWPLTDQVNAFTMSLLVYPVIATGLLLYRAGRVGPGFWALVSGGGAIFVAAGHFGPAAVEPPELILDRSGCSERSSSGRVSPWEWRAGGSQLSRRPPGCGLARPVRWDVVVAPQLRDGLEARPQVLEHREHQQVLEPSPQEVGPVDRLDHPGPSWVPKPSPTTSQYGGTA